MPAFCHLGALPGSWHQTAMGKYEASLGGPFFHRAYGLEG